VQGGSSSGLAGCLLKGNNLSDLLDVSAARTNLGAAPLASPTFTGTPAAPTATVGTDTTQVATTAFVLANGSSSSVAALTPAATVDISLASADYFTITLDQNTTFTMSNVDAGVDTFNLAITGYDSGTSYALGSASYDSVSFSVGTQEIIPNDLAFSSAGDKMYVLGSNSAAVYQYTLSTAFDLSTASYDSVSFSVSTQDPGPQSLAFSSDGTKMFVLGAANDTVYQYTLSTAWVVSSASYDSVSFDVETQEPSATSIKFSSSGDKMYVLGSDNDAVYQYSLSTAWDASTLSYDSVSFSVASQETFPYGMAFSSNGTKMFVMGYNSRTVFAYTLSTAWVVSSASYDSVSFSVASQETAPTSLAFSSNGTKMFVVGAANDTVFQYTTGSSVIATATYPDSFKFPNGQIPSAALGGEVNILEAQTTDGGTTFNVRQLGANFS
jgi:sugar lactone lactonase YvrE